MCYQPCATTDAGCWQVGDLDTLAEEDLDTLAEEDLDTLAEEDLDTLAEEDGRASVQVERLSEEDPADLDRLKEQQEFCSREASLKWQLQLDREQKQLQLLRQQKRLQEQVCPQPWGTDLCFLAFACFCGLMLEKPGGDGMSPCNLTPRNLTPRNLTPRNLTPQLVALSQSERVREPLE
jgi:hypothetical protein